MPVPKRKVSKARRNKRNANLGIKPQAFTYCNECSQPIMPHVACLHCGFYKGAKVFETKADRGVKRVEMRQARPGQASEAQVEPSETKN